MRIIEFLLSGVCHQLPERSLMYQGRTLPLCARCTGTFLGTVLGLMVLRLMGQGRRSELPPGRTMAVLGLLAGFWVVDGINSVWVLLTGTLLAYTPSNTIRLVTGMGTGLAIAAIIYPIYHQAMWAEVEARRVLDSARHLALLLGAGAAIVIVALAWHSAPWVLWAGLVSLAVIAVLAVLNAVLGLLLCGKEGFANHWFQTVPVLFAGLLAAVTEMSALALLRQLLG